jgi:diguanylate cyclase (GGDEF)-like protein
MGQDRMSASWLGVPILAGDNLLGILAIASYTPNAFDEEDANLLSNVGMQAALALDNARQHAAVKEQAQRDSLTGAYNHGFLLKLLNEEVERGRKSRQPVSLIMLDVDLFKIYNDRYGHATGDEVLRLLVQTIQLHVKKADIVGRWGGEEFAIGLPGASPEQAMQVAQRVRDSLALVQLNGKNGKSIPSPTVSQGIATFPLHAQDTEELVDNADMALYQAKHRGRNQVEVADGSTRLSGL